MVTNQPIPPKGGSLFGSTTINWEDVYKGPNIMWRVPRNIRLNDNIVIREDEIAVFFRDGKVLAYIDRPDRYALTSLNAPIVGGLVKELSGTGRRRRSTTCRSASSTGSSGAASRTSSATPTSDS